MAQFLTMSVRNGHSYKGGFFRIPALSGVKVGSKL